MGRRIKLSSPLDFDRRKEINLPIFELLNSILEKKPLHEVKLGHRSYVRNLEQSLLVESGLHQMSILISRDFSKDKQELTKIEIEGKSYIEGDYVVTCYRSGEDKYLRYFHNKFDLTWMPNPLVKGNNYSEEEWFYYRIKSVEGKLIGRHDYKKEDEGKYILKLTTDWYK
ncbi:hypothetical protein H6G33_10405 [Calothrix sp. FACHB-1219]|uniref:hypothetical protein n=1 Tax=unclassified Calothrix TaxID=2619626 RepID=UPI00168424A4|nr:MULTISPECIES: hypothetical protein [unclassified Calothrix]MBD2201758.1 hypothetical protein [Calothrix sp. FACHB-168]MBD2217444.1 hypothetical protein [Calothrix sp. FACHB-1219]